MNKKKIILVFVITLVCVIAIGGGIAAFILTRDNEVIKLDAKDITVNTLVVNDEGTIQSAMVEAFDKDYYDLSELEEFVKDDLDKFNEENDTKITLEEIKANDDKVVLVFGYDSIEEYSAYNEVNNASAYVFDASKAAKDERVPSDLKEIDEDGTVPKDSVYEDEKLTTVVVDADTELIVNGKIKYYSGCEVTAENKVVTKAGERAVVVFK